jgi:hypothetical protein
VTIGGRQKDRVAWSRRDKTIHGQGFSQGLGRSFDQDSQDCCNKWLIS